LVGVIYSAVLVNKLFFIRSTKKMVLQSSVLIGNTTLNFNP